MITKTIGSGGDYPTIIDAWIAIAPSWPSPALLDNYEFLITSDLTEKYLLAFQNTYRATLNGFTVSFVNSSKYKIAIPNLVRYSFISEGNNGGHIVWDGLVFELPYNYGGNALMSFLGGGANGYSVTYKNLYFLGGGVSSGVSSNAISLYDGTSSGWAQQILRVVNCRFYGVGTAIGGAITGGGSVDIENSAIFNCNYGIKIDQKNTTINLNIKNTVCLNTLYDEFIITTNPANAVIANCADSDDSIASSGAALSGNITGIVDGDFLSVDSTSADFLKIDSTSALYKTGTSDISAWNTEDAFGNMRPDGAGEVSIGIHEPVVGYVPPGKKILENKQLVGFKLETNPFIPEALVAADYGHHAYDIKVDPGIELLPLRAARADFSKEVSISGRRLCAANWKVDLYAMTDPATPPTYFSMLRACGWKQVVHGATGVSIKPDGNYNRVPATIEVAYEDESSEPRQLVYKIGGAMGSVKIIGAAGLPVALEFSFLGTLEGITTRSYASRITPTGFDDETPPALLDEQHSIFMSRRSLIENFEISGNEVVDLFSNIFKCHGYDGARVSGRLLTGKIKIGGIMSLVTSHSGGVVAIGYDATTSERGFLTKMVNRTGHTSVKGEIISCSTTADNEAILQNNEYDAIGIVAEEGITEGSEMWVWKSGSRAQVLYKDSTAATRGYILLAADTDGRAIDIAVPSSNPVVAQHFKECGHVCESKDAGTNVLVLSDLHFN